MIRLVNLIQESQRLTLRDYDAEIETLENEWERLDSMGNQTLKQRQIEDKLTKLRHLKNKWETLYNAVNENTDMPPPPTYIQFVPKSSSTNTVNITKAYIAIATLWGEARGEGEHGMKAVMNVIMNRAKGNFNQTDTVILKPKQFSFWNGKSNPEQFALELAKKHRHEKSFQTAVKIVDLAIKGKLEDITGGALYYFNPKLVQPSWAKKLTKTKSIGNHDFYK